MIYILNTKGGSGGNKGTIVLKKGVISTDSAFNTETFQDLSRFRYVAIKIYDTVGSRDYEWTVVFPATMLGDTSHELGITVPLHQTVTYAVSLTSIRCTYYRGAYYYIYADVIGLDEYPFD